MQEIRLSAPKVQIFGLHTLCSILSNSLYLNKIPVSKSISYVFYCFVNFLCISLFFDLLFLLFFFTEICGKHFLKYNKSKTN